MLNANTDAMGIIFPNMYDKLVPELVSERLMASIPFASRYRMIDFLLSSMVNCGIDNITILARKNYFSLIDHLGSGREWDLTRKNGGLNIFPPYAEKTMGMFGERIEGLESLLTFLRDQKEKYVVMSDANIAMNFDFDALLKAHAASGADVTIAYKKEPLPAKFVQGEDLGKTRYYTLDLDGDRVKKININSRAEGIQNFSMNIYVAEREWLIKAVDDAFMRGGIYFERDILIPAIDSLKICGFEYTGYTARITDMKSYFDENMKLLDDENLEALFSGHQIYTKIRDDNPTRYIGDAKASNVMVADGCLIEGEIENCLLFRGVRIGKGAKVKNCILMQDTVVEDGASLEYVVTDKRVTIKTDTELKGNGNFPIFIAKGQTV